MIEKTAISGEPVILAPDREARPNGYDGGPCPFCPGAESETPPEIHRHGDPWRIRVFPNRYPPTDHSEVVVESARHDDTFDALEPDHAQRVVELYFDRYRQRMLTSDYVCLFKNHGPAAGASIPHLHSQIVGTPFVPPRIAFEGASFSRAAKCPLCDLHQHPLIAESRHYRWIAPHGARLAYQQWIVPKAHEHALDEPHELASLLQSSVRAMGSISDSFNWAFLTFPGQPRGHWYVELFPRIAMIAGFELGSGAFVNTIPSDQTARAFAPFAE